MTTKSISIKRRGCKSGGRASKVAKLTSGDLPHVTEIVTEGVARRPDRAAGVSRGRSSPCSRKG